ncbi:hypothetical protein BDV30DRAFT_224717 [Aspergillus minisclerotigenes]|uniref:Uncharacterized protein n=1 Tax=Aspergillus minisclerotigenes TaxID=656917 RepID=A0A5N6JCC9_9EURO|nr:hypothetical protein BDV30DRAFT_224717 [Aspergillus minisclerotigenes]
MGPRDSTEHALRTSSMIATLPRTHSTLRPSSCNSLINALSAGLVPAERESFLPGGTVQEKIYHLDNKAVTKERDNLLHEVQEIVSTGQTRYNMLEFPAPYALAKYLLEQLLLDRKDNQHYSTLIIRPSNSGPCPPAPAQILRLRPENSPPLLSLCPLQPFQTDLPGRLQHVPDYSMSICQRGGVVLSPKHAEAFFQMLARFNRGWEFSCARSDLRLDWHDPEEFMRVRIRILVHKLQKLLFYTSRGPDSALYGECV